MRIAIDVDGVLADQVKSILVRLNAKYGRQWKHEDVIKWDQEFEDTDIEKEINKALLEKNYILEIETIPGAVEAVATLAQQHWIMIASARPTETQEFTMRWLTKHFDSYFKDFINTVDTGKADLDADILIDDNIDHISAFSSNKGVGILFSQPWNREREILEPMIKIGKVWVCNGWLEVKRKIEELDYL